MFQTHIDDYTDIVKGRLPEYLSSLPDPTVGITDYLADKDRPLDKDSETFPVEWFDVAATTALVRNHRDTKREYAVNAFLVEMLTVMFRASVVSLGWMPDDEAFSLASLLAYDTPLDKEKDRMLFHDFCHCLRVFPYAQSTRQWFAFMAPLLAYTRQTPFEKPQYFVRHMASVINKFGIETNRNEHAWEINVDFLKFQRNVQSLLNLARRDSLHQDHHEEYLRNILAEYSRVWLACLLQRSATSAAFGAIASEVVSYHYSHYQEMSQKFLVKQQEST